MTIQVVSAAHALAAMRARQHVKDQLKRQGLKPSHYSAREIGVLAREYLLEHREDLMPEAIARAQAMILSGVLGKRAARELCAKFTTNEQNQIELKSTSSAVQMSGAE
ncbi:MAG TPA: hypothetical protein VEI98_12165 [Xanthobacteraceae bacterium]|nr:hypothetical protein [Xanthobacteraceae bacterium]